MVSFAFKSTPIFALALLLLAPLPPVSAGEFDTQGPNLGQSDWIMPGQDSIEAQPEQLGQSAWIAPAQDQSRGFQASQLGQSEWIMPEQAQPQGYQSGQLGQSEWITPGQSGQSDLSCAATVIPQRTSPQLSAQISQNDYADSPPSSVPMSGAGASMDDMIGQAMMAPMMMAASAGLLGQSFGSYGPGAGLRVCGPGFGFRGRGLAGYVAGRAVNRALNRLRF